MEKIKKQNHKNGALFAGATALMALTPNTHAQSSGPAAKTTPAVTADWQKPVWLTDLSAGVKESYDDNVLLVSGDGLRPQDSWVTGLAPKIGFNFAPLLGSQSAVQLLSLSYSPDLEFYHEAPAENYTANKFNNLVKIASGNFIFSLDNSFLYNDGNRLAETYAVNPSSGTASLQYDKYRNNFAHGVVRERRNQFQDRNTTTLEYDWNQFFIRPTESLLYYGLNTYQFNSSAVPNKGYQNYVNRYDVNGGTDLGYKETPDVAFTVGYRYGSQYQQQFTRAINNNSAYDPQSSSYYQRVLFGVEGKPLNWLTVKIVGGPDFRDYNHKAAVNDDNLITYYGEAALTARINADQSLTFNYKQWQWVSSSGYVPYFDTTYALTYHWNMTHQLGLDLGGKVLEADYTSGNDNGTHGTSSSAPSVRDDLDYNVSVGLSYAFTSHLSANVVYNYDLGNSTLTAAQLHATGVPSAIASSIGFRDFEHQVVSLGLQYKF